MKTISDIYHPITATPFLRDKTYCEIKPCEALRPYIRCFWGTEAPIDASQHTGSDSSEGLVIPDTCMDIIFDINYTQNRYNSLFCAIDEQSYKTANSIIHHHDRIATFAIRFYAHTAILFSERDLKDSKNQIFGVEDFFSKLKREIEPFLYSEPTLEGKAKIAEILLLKHLHPERINNDLMNAVYYMLISRGRSRISDICSYTQVSGKQLERIFHSHIGVSPKAFSSLIRYQQLWQEMMFSKHFCVLDAVEKYGYTDQSHLLKDFKRRHTMLPNEAIAFAGKSR